MKIPIEHHLLLSKLYQEAGVPLDRLPYTPQFEQLHAQFCAQSRMSAALQEVWEQLWKLRKSNHLAKIRKAKAENANIG